MKKQTVLAGVLVAIAIAVIYPAAFVSGHTPGEREICVHGNSGQLQDRNVSASHHGWGIDYDVAGTGTWLQYSIPIEKGTKVKGIRVLFYRQGQHYKDSWIRHVHVYDGPNVIKKFDDIYVGKGVEDQTIHKTLTFGPTKFTHGVGVSILPETKESASLKAIVNMEFRGVSAITVYP